MSRDHNYVGIAIGSDYERLFNRLPTRGEVVVSRMVGLEDPHADRLIKQLADVANDLYDTSAFHYTTTGLVRPDEANEALMKAIESIAETARLVRIAMETVIKVEEEM